MWSRASIFPMVQKISIYLITKSRWFGWGGGVVGGEQRGMYGMQAPSSERQLDCEKYASPTGLVGPTGPKSLVGPAGPMSFVVINWIN